uniref:Uncharacterized protein n=1 Tax=Aegilops tauschii subsp. strangulata TaxID=200361 RepID=A0A453PVU2_AEGTS
CPVMRSGGSSRFLSWRSTSRGSSLPGAGHDGATRTRVIRKLITLYCAVKLSDSEVTFFFKE